MFNQDYIDRVSDGSLQALRQVAALPVRERDGLTEVCLITTRETGRWTIPKGWPMKGVSDRDAAAVEAREEAGLKGSTAKKVLGEFLYWKRREQHFDLVRVAVYRMKVTGQLKRWREMAQREVRWFAPTEAAALVEEPGLSALIAAQAD